MQIALRIRSSSASDKMSHAPAHASYRRTSPIFCLDSRMLPDILVHFLGLAEIFAPQGTRAGTRSMNIDKRIDAARSQPPFARLTMARALADEARSGAGAT